jgi:hypothetical protein
MKRFFNSYQTFQVRGVEQVAALKFGIILYINSPKVILILQYGVFAIFPLILSERSHKEEEIHKLDKYLYCLTHIVMQVSDK